MNVETALIFHFLSASITAGVLGTTVMTAFFYYISRVAKIVNAKMVTAIGSVFTKETTEAWKVGLFLHYVSGIAFAMVYTFVFSLFQLEGMLFHGLVGLGFGFGHGFVMSFILVATVAEHHPLEEFRDAGVEVAVAHLVGHVFYGVVVGLTIGFSGFSTAGAVSAG